MRVITSYQPANARPKPRRRRRLRRFGFLLIILLLVAGGTIWYWGNQSEPTVVTASKSEPQKPAVVTPPQPDAQLEAIFANWAQQHPEHQWSVVVRELDHDKRFASFAASEVYNAASIYKLFLTYLLFKDITLDQVDS